MATQNLLTSKQVAEVVGIKYATLDSWLRPERGGFLECTEPAAGRGSNRGFSFLDVLRIDAVARMRRGGVPLQTIRQVLTDLTERYRVEDPLLAGRLVVAGTRLFWALDDATLLDVLTQQLASTPLVILPVGEMIKDNRRKMVELFGEADSPAARAVGDFTT